MLYIPCEVHDPSSVERYTRASRKSTVVMSVAPRWVPNSQRLRKGQRDQERRAVHGDRPLDAEDDRFTVPVVGSEVEAVRVAPE